MAQVGYAALSVDIGGASVIAADDAGMKALRIACRIPLVSHAHLAHISPTSRPHLTRISPTSRPYLAPLAHMPRRTALPTVSRGRSKFPLVLPGHSAFQTPLMAPMAATLRGTPPFHPPQIPMIDGAGRVWEAGCDLDALRRYTIDEQVCDTWRVGGWHVARVCGGG